MILVIRNLWQPCTCQTTAAVNMMMMMLFFIWLLAPDSTPKTNKHNFVKNRLLLPSYSKRDVQLLSKLHQLDPVLVPLVQIKRIVKARHWSGQYTAVLVFFNFLQKTAFFKSECY